VRNFDDVVARPFLCHIDMVDGGAKPMKFNRYKSEITPPPRVFFQDIGEMAAALHHAIATENLQYICLDFSECHLAEPEFMLAVCSLVRKYQTDGIRFSLKPPTDEKLSRLFLNTNWAHHISPTQFPLRTFNGYTRVPATHFSNSDEQSQAINSIIDVILSSVEGVQRADFAAFEWAINEMADNVLNHSESHSGFVQASHLRNKKKKISFIVCDIGIGIPDSLRSGGHKVQDDAAALLEAIKEGVTRDKAIGQGNGLFGSHRVSVNSGGNFKIRSGYAALHARPSEITAELQKVPFKGTVISAEIDFSSPGLLESALHFSDGPYKAWTRLESIYEDEQHDIIKIRVKDSAESYGSRKAGEPLRRKIKSLMDMHPNHEVNINFSGVEITTSSFADEILGKLLIEIGAKEFKRRVRITGLNSINEAIVNRSLSQRAQQLSIAGEN